MQLQQTLGLDSFTIYVVYIHFIGYCFFCWYQIYQFYDYFLNEFLILLFPFK